MCFCCSCSAWRLALSRFLAWMRVRVRVRVRVRAKVRVRVRARVRVRDLDEVPHRLRVASERLVQHTLRLRPVARALLSPTRPVRVRVQPARFVLTASLPHRWIKTLHTHPRTTHTSRPTHTGLTCPRAGKALPDAHVQTCL